jgi:hypothetical protein
MESTSSLEKPAEPPSHRWANLMGTLIAVLTLTIPALAISYYSSYNAPIAGQTYSITRPER